MTDRILTQARQCGKTEQLLETLKSCKKPQHSYATVHAALYDKAVKRGIIDPNDKGWIRIEILE